MKLALGTAQFGYDYGISNKKGKTPAEEVKKILELASQSGVDLLDTAHHYRESESVLGSCDPLQKKFRIVTKTPAFKDLPLRDAAAPLGKAFLDSLSKLRCESVYGLLFHSGKVLSDPEGNHPIQAALKLKDAGRVRKVGVSIYTPEEAMACARSGWVEIVQAPFSLLDQRLLTSGALHALADKGIEVHVRSVFLQGLMFMKDDELPAFFQPIRSELAERRKKIAAAGLSSAQATFAFLNQFSHLSQYVIGVTNEAELKELIAGSATKSPLPFGEFALSNELFINPANWKL